MSREDPQLKLRLTEEMKARVTEAARANGRSVNAEIVARLTDSFEFEMISRSPEASFEALKPILEAAKAEVSKRYEDRFATIEELILRITENLGIHNDERSRKGKK